MASQASKREAAEMIRSLLAWATIDKDDLCEYLGIARRSLDNKLYRCTFSAGEMLDIIAYCGAKMAVWADKSPTLAFNWTFNDNEEDYLA